MAQGQAVVQTPTSGWTRRPAGPSAVVRFGTPYSGRLPSPKVLDTPTLGCPFDDLGKIAPSAWVLEKGRYTLYAGTSVRPFR